MRLTAEKLSNQMKQAREGLEDDLKETRDVVKDLKDFLSGKHCCGAEYSAGRLVPHRIHPTPPLVYGREVPGSGYSFVPIGRCKTRDPL